MATLNYTVGVQVSGGPQINVSRSKEIEAFDKVEIKLDPKGPNAAAVSVELQPGAAAKIAMLLIKSSVYDKLITFQVSDGTNESDALTLEEPHVFVGDGMTLFGVDRPTSLKFANACQAADASKKALIEVFVARRATA